MNSKPETVLVVQGMTCGSCVRHVTEALYELDGVDRVDVDLSAGIVAIEHDTAVAPADRLIGALQDAGYPSEQRNA